jgi:hypothetical protein
MQWKLKEIAALSLETSIVVGLLLLTRGLLEGLAEIMLWVCVGYFVGDWLVAMDHYFLDNHRPNGSGFVHHEVRISARPCTARAKVE